MVGPDRLVGASAGTPERAAALVAAGADYLGVGAIFDASATKPNATHNRGLDALRAVRTAVGDVPLFAIGGISAHNAALCVAAGADGVASVRATLGADDVAAAVGELRASLSRG